MEKGLPFLLLVAVISASLFMIVESGEYYSRFYDNDYQGYWAALLVEGFLAIAAVMHLDKHKKLNFCIKIAMIPLFLVVVGGASLKVASPIMTELAKAKAQEKLVIQLDKINEQSEVHLALLQGQKTNTALAIKHQRQVSNQLISELKDKPSTPVWMLWIVIGFSTFLRMSVQLANLVFAHALGELWKNQKGAFNSDNKGKQSITRKSNLQTKLEKIYRYLIKSGGKA
ncbi:MAG: hypothetical protein MJE63_19655, partial [Proteobacteria bacterium]|nr:hypothetical protein [Pseudomonadota bacterium]